MYESIRKEEKKKTKKMNSPLQYLIESSICLALFYSLYWLFLKKETFFKLNRFFLLLSIPASIYPPAPQHPLPFCLKVPFRTNVRLGSACGSTGSFYRNHRYPLVDFSPGYRALTGAFCVSTYSVAASDKEKWLSKMRASKDCVYRK